MDTPKVQDFRLLSCQATLFTPDEEVSPAKLMRGLLASDRWSERFNDDPLILPKPTLAIGMGDVETSLRAMPRLILESKSSEGWRCEISSERINLFWHRKNEESREPTLSSFFAEAASFLIEYQESLRARTGRLAAVIKKYVLHPSPGQFLAQRFCKEELLLKPFNRPMEFELHAHKRYTLGEKFHCNSWVRSKTGKLSSASSEEQKQIVFVEQDLNTLSEDLPKQDFLKQDIEQFFSIVPDEFDEILKLYYP